MSKRNEAVSKTQVLKRTDNGSTNEKYENTSQIEILGDDVIYVSDGINESYTFQIEKDKSDLIENLIIISRIVTAPENKTYNAYIATYNLSMGDEINLDEREDIALLENASIYSISLDNIGALISKREDIEC